MADQPYTEADVRLVGDALDAYYAAMGMPASYRPYGAAKVALAALAAAGRLLPEAGAREVWLIGTDYMDDEVFGVVATREEVDAMRERVSDRSDLSLNAVRYSVPYPSASQDQGSTDE